MVRICCPLRTVTGGEAYVLLSPRTRTHSYRVRSRCQVCPRICFRTSSGSHSGPSLLRSGVTPVVYPEVYPLERLADGLGALENRKTWGKAIVRIKDEPTPTAKL